MFFIIFHFFSNLSAIKQQLQTTTTKPMMEGAFQFGGTGGGGGGDEGIFGGVASAGAGSGFGGGFGVGCIGFICG